MLPFLPPVSPSSVLPIVVAVVVVGHRMTVDNPVLNCNCTHVPVVVLVAAVGNKVVAAVVDIDTGPGHWAVVEVVNYCCCKVLFHLWPVVVEVASR